MMTMNGVRKAYRKCRDLFLFQKAEKHSSSYARDHVRTDEKIDFGRLKFQVLISYLVFLPFGYLFVAGLKFWGRFQVSNMREIRKQFREIAKKDAPLIICSNHLTYIDSAIIIWALAPIWWYFFHFKKLSWNFPAGDHFRKKWIHRVVAFLSKCIYIHRDGSVEHKNSVLNTAFKLLQKGHFVTLFPEGQRSRTGRFDLNKRTYGVGKLLSQLKEKRVLCVYLRGNKQENYTAYPPLGSTFFMDMELIHPSSNRQGREAYSDYVQQVTSKIHQLEEKYFADRSAA